MHHQCSGHIHNSFNIPLRFGIILLCFKTRKTLRSTFILTILLKHIFSEDAIITTEMLDIIWCLVPKPLLKIQLSHNGLNIFNRQLIFNRNNSRCGVIIDDTSMKITIGSLSNIFTQKLIRSFEGKMIRR